jgi:nucleotide-binding universal stress UspA family protein
MNNKVLACLDHSSYVTAVCDYASWAALQLKAPLEFIHVLDRHPEVAPRIDLTGSIGLGSQEHLLEDLAELDERRSKIALERGRLLLEGAKQRSLADGVANPESRQRHGELVETLGELEQEARLFVLVKRGEAADSAPQHLGGNIERVVRALHRPILVVPQEFKSPSRFLVAFDASMTTRKGIDMIASSPLFHGLEAHIVMVSNENAAARMQLDWAVSALAKAGFSTSAAIVHGDPESALTDYIHSKHIDILVMGAYGHSRIRQLLVGSTTTTMIRTSMIPVLLLR